MEFGPHPLQKIVSAINGTTIALTNIFSFYQLAGAHHAVAKIADPLHVMVVAQSTAAILDVRLLHEDRTPVFAVPFILVFQPPFQVVIHLSPNTALEILSAEFRVASVVAGQ